MEVWLLALLIFASLLVLLVSGIPITFGLMAVAITPFLLIRGPDSLVVMINSVFATLTKDVYLPLPTFIFMAAVLEFSGLGSRMYTLMHKWMAGLKGGLAMGTIGIATAMAAMSGTAATATLTMGMLAYPEMERRGYDKKMSLGCIPAGGILGPLIPPSVLAIIVCSIAQLSIGKMFMAGVFPGFLASAGFMTYIGIRCLINPAMGPALPPEERVGWKEKFMSLPSAGLPFLLIFLVLGLIYMGVCTPTEAGGIGAVGAMICAFVYHNLTLANLRAATARSLRITAMLMWLLIAGCFFSYMMGVMGVQGYIRDILVGLEVNRWVILIMILGLVFIMGMFMDDTPIMVIFLPVFLPVIDALGFDIFWFVFVFAMDCLIGIMTPPFGMVLFYFKGLNIPGVTMMDIYLSVIPYILVMIAVLIICILFPPIVTWLPSMMFTK